MSQQPITLTAHEFWSYAKNDADCDEILELLEGRNELISHFLYFSSLGHTLDDLNELMKKKKKEIGHVFTELTQSPVFRQRTAQFVRQKHRLHPYRRPTTTSPTTTTRANSGDSILTPIDVDAINDSPPSSSSSSFSSATTSFVTAPTNPPTRPTTPEPPFGTAHRIYHDNIHYFAQDGIYYVRCELSGHIYTEEEYYGLPRAPYRHSLPQLRLPTLPRMIQRTSHHV
jgi:hypothetical protein